MWPGSSCQEDGRRKPSPVPPLLGSPRGGGGIISLGPGSLRASSGLPGTLAGRATPRPLFGLAPGGVCRATPVASGPVRSYRTLSPLPVPPGGPSAVCSLWHFPSPRGARALPGTLPCGARTFLRPASPADSRRRSLSPSSWSPMMMAPTGGGSPVPMGSGIEKPEKQMFIKCCKSIPTLVTNVLLSRDT